MNSGLDPLGDISTSEQGLGFDQYEALYNNYCVVGWNVKIEFVTTENTVPMVVGFTPTTYSGGLTDYKRAKELPGTVSKIVTPDLDKITLLSSGKVKRWFMPNGGKLLSNENCTAAVSANPNSILYGYIWTQPLDMASDPAGVVQFCVTVEQVIVFFNPKAPSRSTQ